MDLKVSVFRCQVSGNELHISYFYPIAEVFLAGKVL